MASTLIWISKKGDCKELWFSWDWVARFCALVLEIAGYPVVVMRESECESS